MKVYLAREASLTIEEVEVERVSESSIWIKDTLSRRPNQLQIRRRQSWPGYYCDTLEDARNYLLAYAERQVELAQSALDRIPKLLADRQRDLAEAKLSLDRVKALHQ